MALEAMALQAACHQDTVMDIHIHMDIPTTATLAAATLPITVAIYVVQLLLPQWPILPTTTCTIITMITLGKHPPSNHTTTNRTKAKCGELTSHKLISAIGDSGGRTIRNELGNDG